MSNLDFIRSLRRALAGLRDAYDPSAADDVARALADELHLMLGHRFGSDSSGVIPDVDGEQPPELGMAVCA